MLPLQRIPGTVEWRPDGEATHEGELNRYRSVREQCGPCELAKRFARMPAATTQSCLQSRASAAVFDPLLRATTRRWLQRMANGVSTRISAEVLTGHPTPKSGRDMPAVVAGRRGILDEQQNLYKRGCLTWFGRGWHPRISFYQ